MYADLSGALPTIVSTTAGYTSGQALVSRAGVSAPAFGPIDLSLADWTVTGLLPISSGGTGYNFPITNPGGIMYQNNSGQFRMSAGGTAGQVLLSGGIGAPTWGAASTALAIVDDTTTATPHYLVFNAAATGNLAPEISSTKLTYTPSTGLLIAPLITVGGGSSSASLTPGTGTLTISGTTYSNFNGRVTFPAGTTGTSAASWTAGVAPSSATTGDMWASGSGIYYRTTLVTKSLTGATWGVGGDPTATDLNSASAGWSNCQLGTTTNAPESYGTCFTFSNLGDNVTPSGSAWLEQWFYGTVGGVAGHTWRRSNINLSGWTAWKKMWDSSNLTNLSQLTNGPAYISGLAITNDNTTNADHYVVVSASSSGNLAPKVGATYLKYNPFTAFLYTYGLAATNIQASSLSTPTATQLTFNSTLTDTAYAYEAAFNFNNTVTRTNGYLMRVHNNGTLKFAVDFAGSAVAVNYYGFGTATLVGQVANGSTAVCTILDNSTSQTTAGGKLLSIRNATVEKGYVDYLGNFNGLDFIASSDARLKTGIVTIPDALARVTAMRGVNYYRKDDPTALHMGVIAQEMEEVAPEVVSTDSQGMKSVSYNSLVGILIEAIKDQQKQILDLQRRLDGVQGGSPWNRRY
jgi:hypothetical protein